MSGEKIAHCGGELVNFGHPAIQMRDKADMVAIGDNQYPLCRQMITQPNASTLGKIDKHHVGFYRRRIGSDAGNCGKLFGKPQGIVMVTGKTVDVMIKSVEASRRKNAGLTHTTANELANAVGPPDK